MKSPLKNFVKELALLGSVGNLPQGVKFFGFPIKADSCLASFLFLELHFCLDGHITFLCLPYLVRSPFLGEFLLGVFLIPACESS